MKAASFRNEDGTVPFEIVEGIRTKLMKAILAEMNKARLWRSTPLHGWHLLKKIHSWENNILRRRAHY